MGPGRFPAFFLAKAASYRTWNLELACTRSAYSCCQTTLAAIFTIWISSPAHSCALKPTAQHRPCMRCADIQFNVHLQRESCILWIRDLLCGAPRRAARHYGLGRTRGRAPPDLIGSGPAGSHVLRLAPQVALCWRRSDLRRQRPCTSLT
jgi:hypothetical protein